MAGKFENGKWYFSVSEKHEIIQEYLNSPMSKNAIWKKYTGQSEERGHLLRWMRRLGYSQSGSELPNGQSGDFPMKEKKDSSAEDQRYASLLAENAALKQALTEAELQLKIESTIITVAEKQLGIAIRKKFATPVSES